MRSLGSILTRPRLRYAWLAGAVLWLGWLLSIGLGEDGFDLAGNVVGTDYLQFYAAGRTLQIDQGSRLYDFSFQGDLQRRIVGSRRAAYHAFITPPFLAWLYLPLSWLGYGMSLAAWSLLGLVGLGASLRLLGATAPGRTFAWSLTWFPVFAGISFGQNSLLSLALLSGIWWTWSRGRCWQAGLLASLLLYKPPLLLGLLVLWLLDLRRDWRALVSLGIGGASLAAASFWMLPEASWAYLRFAISVMPDLPDWNEFPMWHLHSVRGFWRMLLPSSPFLGDLLALVVASVAILAFYSFWRRTRDDRAVVFAGAVCLTFLCTPHAMIYDLVLLLAPSVLLWRALPGMRSEWRVVFAAIWVVSFVSGPLTHAQLYAFPFALQLSVPVLAFAFVGTALRVLRERERFAGLLSGRVESRPS